jgi:hypothetical protein
MDDWTCLACNGEVTSMGVLGNREHGRCRACGADQSRTVKILRAPRKAKKAPCKTS